MYDRNTDPYGELSKVRMPINPLIEAPTYIGTKVITGAPITLGEYNKYRGWEMPKDEDPRTPGYIVEYQDGGKANHPNHKNYISWSPRNVFEEAYRLTEGLPFGLAVEAAKKGKRIARLGWNGADMFAFIEMNEEQFLTVWKGEDFTNHPKRPCWYLKTAQNDIATWAPSGSDTLADDWVILN